MAAMSNYLENKVLDWLLRGQAFAPPATIYLALMTSAPDDAGGGVEVAGGGYARVGVTSNLANWAGTQGAGTTTPSSGGSGTTSNNNVLTFPSPTGYWGLVSSIAVFDQPTGGNLLWSAQLTAARTIQAGDPAPSFPATTLTLQIDD